METMFNPTFALLKKEYLLMRRGAMSIGGLVLYSALFIFLFCFLLRESKVAPSEVGLVSFSGLWLITLFVAFRYSLQSYKEESEKDIFMALMDSGFSAESIIYSKLLFGSLILLALSIVNFSLFSILMGFPEIMRGLFFSFIIFLMAIPGLAMIGSLGAIISILSKEEEILMAVTVVPISLYYGVLVVSEAENAFRQVDLDFSSHGILSFIGISVILFLLAPLLAKSIFKSNRVI